MSFDRMELTITGRWPSTSRTPERYGRSVCSGELLLRNAIAQMMADGRPLALAPARHRPIAGSGHIRIGKRP